MENECNDFEKNKIAALEVIKNYQGLLPAGLTLYVTDVAFGINFKHPIEDAKANSGYQVKLNQNYTAFQHEANDACQALFKIAKHSVNKYLGLQQQALETRTLVSQGVHRGVYQNDDVGHLNESWEN